MKAFATVLAGLILCCVGVRAQNALQESYDDLREAVEAKKGPAEIKKMVLDTMVLVKKYSGPLPDGFEKDSWAETVKYAQTVQEFAEYAIYSALVTAPPAAQPDLLATLDQINSKSKYLTGEAILQMAGVALSAQQYDRASSLAKRALAIGDKPANAAAAHYLIGYAAFNKKDYATTSTELRPLMPSIDAARKGVVLYMMGVSTYQLGRQVSDRAQINQGIDYTRQASLIPGQYQQMSATTLTAMKAEAGVK